MDEYISRHDALLHSEIIRVYSKDYGNIDVVPVEYLADIPAADVQPVKHGRWMYPFYCSECGFTPYYSSDLTYNYCPNCGARMDVIYQDDKIKAVRVVGWDGDSE